MIGGVHRSTVRVLGVTTTGIGVEQPPLAFLNFADALVDRVLREEPVHLNAAGLPHAVSAGDCLFLDTGLPMRLRKDDDRRRLNVEANTTRLDLGDDDGMTVLVGELLHEALTLGDRDVAVNASDDSGDLLNGLFRNWSAAEGVTGLGAGVVSLR